MPNRERLTVTGGLRPGLGAWERFRGSRQWGNSENHGWPSRPVGRAGGVGRRCPPVRRQAPAGVPVAGPGRSPFTAQGTGPFGSRFRPADPSQLFVSNAHNGTGPGTVSAFTDSGAGALASIGSSPVADQQTAPCRVTISPDGRCLFAVNTGSGAISRYSIAPGGALTLLGSTRVSANGGAGAVDPGVSPDGRFLYVNESKISSVGAFAVSGGGNLTELPGSPTPLPAGATPAGIAVS
jgi:DNA-binding beta-propeller fold protein YncE